MFPTPVPPDLRPQATALTPQGVLLLLENLGPAMTVPFLSELGPLHVRTSPEPTLTRTQLVPRPSPRQAMLFLPQTQITPPWMLHISELPPPFETGLLRKVLGPCGCPIELWVMALVRSLVSELVWWVTSELIRESNTELCLLRDTVLNLVRWWVPLWVVCVRVWCLSCAWVVLGILVVVLGRAHVGMELRAWASLGVVVVNMSWGVDVLNISRVKSRTSVVENRHPISSPLKTLTTPCIPVDTLVKMFELGSW